MLLQVDGICTWLRIFNFHTNQKSKAMMVANRRFEIWLSGGHQPGQRYEFAGDAFDIQCKLEEKFGIVCSKSSLYRIAKGSKKEFTSKLDARLPKNSVRVDPVRVFVKCVH